MTEINDINCITNFSKAMVDAQINAFEEDENEYKKTTETDKYSGCKTLAILYLNTNHFSKEKSTEYIQYVKDTIDDIFIDFGIRVIYLGIATGETHFEIIEKIV